MLNLNFSPFPVIKTNRMVLRQLRNEDQDEIFRIRTDEEAARLIPRNPIKKLEEAQEFIKKVNAGVTKNEALYWGLSLIENSNSREGKIIGTICLWNISTQNHRAEIGFELLPDFQGKGLMGEALKSVIDYGFQNMNLHSIEGNVNPFNLASIKLMEKNDFVREAYFKENLYYNGQFLDSAVYSLIAPRS